MPAPAASLPQSPRPTDPLGLRVLCVDDNEDAADTLAALLQLYGAEAVAVHSGPEALAAAERFRPDVCVLDLSMPGMDGLEVARRLRDAAAGRPLLLAAGTAMEGVRVFENEVDAGFDLHFTKPIEPAELIEALADYARQRRSAAG